MANHSSGNHTRYYVPEPSAWPFMLTVGLVLVILGVGHWLEGASPIPVEYPIIAGVALAFFIIFRWFRGVAMESEGGAYGTQVDSTFRWAMSWFIFSEVMFFSAFFGELFYTRVLSVPWLEGSGYRLFTNLLLWPHFTAVWPIKGPAAVDGHL